MKSYSLLKSNFWIEEFPTTEGKVKLLSEFLAQETAEHLLGLMEDFQTQKFLYLFWGRGIEPLSLALWARMICSSLQLPWNRTHDQTFCSPSVKRSSSRWTKAFLFAAAASPSTSTDRSGKTFRPGWTRSIASSPTGNGATTLPVRLDLEF